MIRMWWLVVVGMLTLQMALANVVSNSILDDAEDSAKHHKVHNLVLYPEKHSWCELKPIRQIVTHAHCTSKQMENFVCVGTCFSYSVPQTEPEIPGDKMLDYCDSCQAEESHWTIVTLDCEDDGQVFEVRKNIQMITNCSCSSCSLAGGGVARKSVSDQHSEHISDLLHTITPDHMTDMKHYSHLSLADIKKEIKLNANQELVLQGKVLMRHDASFVDQQDDENAERGFRSN